MNPTSVLPSRHQGSATTDKRTCVESPFLQTQGPLVIRAEMWRMLKRSTVHVRRQLHSVSKLQHPLKTQDCSNCTKCKTTVCCQGFWQLLRFANPLAIAEQTHLRRPVLLPTQYSTISRSTTCQTPASRLCFLRNNAKGARCAASPGHSASADVQ